MRRPLFLALVLAVPVAVPASLVHAAPSAAVDEAEQQFTLPEIRAAERFTISTRGSLVVEPDGRLTEVQLAMDEPARSAYQKAIAEWRMHPVVIDGQVVRAKAHFQLEGFGTVIPGTGKVQLGVDQVWFIDPPEQRQSASRAIIRMSPPSYPQRAAQAGYGASVDLMLALDAEGRVRKAGVARMSLVSDSIRQRGEAIRFTNDFVSAALSAAKRWTIAPEYTETAPEGPEGRTVIVPVRFVSPTRVADGWQPRIPVDVTRPTWMIMSETQAVALMPGGEAPSSQFQLTNEVSGQILN